MGSYYDFSEMLSELETLNGTADEIYTLLGDIYERDGEVLTELREASEEQKKQLDGIKEAQEAGTTMITALIVLCTAVSVIFR